MPSYWVGLRRIIPVLFAGFFLLVLGWGTVPGQAQEGDTPDCVAIVDLALWQVGNNCADLPRNSACYGYNSVQATFTEAVAPDYFTHPADTSPLNTLETIQTAPLDLGLGQWGVAVMNAQANIPDTLPGESVIFLLLGDTQLENAVEPAGSDEPGAVVPGGSVTVITQTAGQLLTGPGLDNTITGDVQAGTVLEVDARSDDGLWLRVVTASDPLWILREAVNQIPALDTLPPASAVDAAPVAQVESTGETPMQAFYFRTTLGAVTCQQTPSTLAIQSPEGITVDLTANGAHIRLGSLILLDTPGTGDTMRLTTLTGNALLEPGTPNEINVPAGFTTTRCLDAPDSLGIDGQLNDRNVGPDCTWTPPQPSTDDDLKAAGVVGYTMGRLGAPVGDTQTPPQQPPPQTSDCATGTNIQHTVAPGENLFRLALRYRTTIADIMRVNNLTDPQRIIVGQTLTMPCGVDSGLPSVPPQGQIPPQTPPDQGALQDCTGFRPTSPLDGLPYGPTIFYWDPAPGATGYILTVYNESRLPVITQNTTATSASVDMSKAGLGLSFTWVVQALFNGVVGCTTQPVTLNRAAEPTARPVVSPLPPFCNFNYVCEPGLGETMAACPSDC